MSSEGPNFSRIFSEIKQEFVNFANSYATAVKSGANVAGQKILKAIEELDRPEDIPAGKLIAAVKIGVQNAAEQMVNSGADFVKQMKSKKKRK